MDKLLIIFFGGGVGSVTRYAMMKVIARLTPGALFPLPTLGVNLAGAFLIGVLLEVLALRAQVSGNAKFLLVTGFLGGFTTFSAFSLDAALMIERGDWLACGVYILLSVVGTIAAVFIGSGLVKAVM